MADANGTGAKRRCTTCGEQKPATRDHFHAYKRSPDGCRAVCKACRAADHATHRDERLPQRRAHYQKNKDRLLAAVRHYYQRNAEAQRASALERHHRNRETRLLRMRAYRAQNLDALNERRRPRARSEFKRRYGEDLAFTLKHRLRALIWVTLAKGREGLRMRELLGYDSEELKAHLERQFTAGMNWSKFLSGDVHIDHILPVASFDIRSADSPEFRACWALANLRPMWAGENLSKGDKVLTLL